MANGLMDYYEYPGIESTDYDYGPVDFNYANLNYNPESFQFEMPDISTFVPEFAGFGQGQFVPEFTAPDFGQLPESGGLMQTLAPDSLADLSQVGPYTSRSDIVRAGGIEGGYPEAGATPKQNWWEPIKDYAKGLGKEAGEAAMANPIRTLGALGSLGLMGAGLISSNKGSAAQRQATEMALKQQREQEAMLGPYRQVLAQRIQAAQSGDLATAIPNEYRQGQEYLGRTEAELRRAFGPQAASSTAFQNAMANAQQKVQGMYTSAINQLMSTGGQLLTSSYGPSNQTLSTLGGLAAQSAQADRQRNQGLLQAGGLLGGMVARWPDAQQQRKAAGGWVG